MLVGTYNPWLVAISLLVAVMASYTSAQFLLSEGAARA